MNNPAAAPVVDVVVTAAGSGRRLGAEVPKAFVQVAGASLLAHSVRAARAVQPRRIVVTIPSEDARRWADAVRSSVGPEVAVVEGGATRQASVHAGLRALSEAAAAGAEQRPGFVLVHDAARPCATPDLWRSVLQAAVRAGAAVPALPVADCLKRRDDRGRVVATLERAGIVRVQTPQGFRFDRLWAAHEAAPEETEAVDDAVLVERLGDTVVTVAGEPGNLKVTTTGDLSQAAAMLAGPEREGPARVGYGWDVHPLVPARRLVLGGVHVPSEVGPVGHSDADVLTHAIIDALLGAAGMGDIGMRFPADDPKWEGADSLELLARVLEEVRAAGFEVSNVDSTIVAERPALSPHLADMRRRLAGAMLIPEGVVNVKATRGEGIGGLGRGEGIAAHAVALLRRVRIPDE